MKRHLLTIICLLTLTTGVLAQKPDVKTLENCEQERKKATEQLNKERVAHKATKDSVQKLNAAFEREKEANEKLINERRKETNRPQETQNIVGENCQELKDSLRIAKMEKEKAEKEKKVLQNTIDNLEKSKKTQPELAVPISKIQEVFPFFVTDINVRNAKKKDGANTPYDKVIYSKKIEWLTVQIDYTSLIDKKKNIMIEIKIYMPNGSLWKYPFYNAKTQTYDLLDYSTKELDAPIYPIGSSFTVNEWGKNMKSNFPDGKLKKKGKYRIEIWHNNVCLGSATFEKKKK